MLDARPARRALRRGARGPRAGHDVRHRQQLPHQSRHREGRREPRPLGGERACSTISSLAPSGTAGSCCSPSRRSPRSAPTTISNLTIDAVPDITNVQVQINTEAPGYLAARGRAAHHVRDRDRDGGPAAARLHALGLALRPVAGHRRVRGRHRHLLRAPARRRNACKKCAPTLPPGLEPELGPIATGLGEIFSFILSVAPGARRADGTPYDTTDLHTVMDWVVRPQLARVPGVTEVNMIGGHERQYVVAPRPAALLAFGLTLADLAAALERNNVERRRRLHRALRQPVPGARAGPSRLARRDLRAIRIATHDGTPIVVGDVAEVSDRQGPAHRRRDDERRGSRARHRVHADGREQPHRRARGRRQAHGDQRVAARRAAGSRPSTTARRSSTRPSPRCARTCSKARCSSSPCCSRCSATCARRSSRRS